MSAYDYIPVEHHGMSEWTLFVFVVVGIATVIAIKLFEIWKINHDSHMQEQVKRIDAHDVQLNSIATDLVVIKTDIGYVKTSLGEIKTPIENMTELTHMVFEKVLEEKK